SRGWANVARGIHVEIEPFGTTRPFRKEGRSCLQNDLAIKKNGAYVEFDVPPGIDMLEYSCGSRKTALVPTDQPLSLEGLNPVFVKVPRYFWEWWRAKPE